MNSNRFKYRLFLAAGIIILSLIAYLSAGAASTTRTFAWAPPLTLVPGQVLTAEPNGDGVFRLWGLCPGCSNKYGFGLQQVWVEDNWPDAVALVNLDGDENGQLEVAAVIGAWQGRKGPYTIWANAYHQVNGSSFAGNSFWATSYYAPNYGGSLEISSPIASLSAGGNLVLEASGSHRRDELAVAAGNQLAVFDYHGLIEAGTPAITKLFQEPLPEPVKGLTAGDLNGDDVDELVVLTYTGQDSILRVWKVTENGLSAHPLATWTGSQEGWKMPVIGDACGDGTKEIWVHSQLRSPLAGVLRAFQLGSVTPVATINGLGPYDRFTVGPVSGMTKDVIALFKIDPTGNTVKLVTLDNSFSNEVSIPGSPGMGRLAHDNLYITGYGNGGRTSGTFLLQVFKIAGLSLELTASRVGGVRGEVEPTDLAVVP